MTTFAQLEKELKNEGFVCEILDRRISRFRKGDVLAFVMYQGLGYGFTVEKYGASKEIA